MKVSRKAYYKKEAERAFFFLNVIVVGGLKHSSIFTMTTRELFKKTLPELLHLLVPSPIPTSSFCLPLGFRSNQTPAEPHPVYSDW